MSYLEPDDPIEPVCPDCGEEENIEHVEGDMWKCLVCKDTFDDGSYRVWEFDDDI